MLKFLVVWAWRRLGVLSVIGVHGFLRLDHVVEVWDVVWASHT
jgi:hypothetical protein